jgi:type I restriction enzyme M protein
VDRTADATKRLWTLCNVLRDDGITYNEYISELTLILFFKLASQLGVEQDIPSQYQWSSQVKLTGGSLLDTYVDALEALANSTRPALRTIFEGSSTNIKNAASLARLLAGIDSIDWQGLGHDSIGEIYESLIDKNAQESRYGAGQYFTPRALVNAMVTVSKPIPGDSLYDPAAGTAGFLVAAGLYSRSQYSKSCGLVGNELVRDVSRLGQMNLHLHGLDASLDTADALALDPTRQQHSLCLTNPPFGIKSDLNPRQQAYLQFPTSNKQLCFLQHIYSSLAPGGRAAVVVPDNVLYESGIAEQIRTHLLDNFNLHTMLRLPTGIFYATGVKTSVLFFARTEPTANTWIYDLRAQKPNFTKKRPLAADDLADFVACYGPDPLGCVERAPSAHYQAFSRQDIRASDDRLDLLGQSTDGPAHSSPSAMLEVIARELEQATSAVTDLKEILGRAGAVD